MEEFSDQLIFYTIGDWGSPGAEVQAVAKAMDTYAKVAKPAFILACGDNFYPNGLSSVNSKRWDTQWRDVFLKYDSLKVRWNAILGNHDYQDNPEAQIEYTTSSKNVGNYWHLPSKCYNFTTACAGFNVDFFGLDTNGAQNHVRSSHPKQEKLLFEYKKWLASGLSASKSDWKIVFAHHPLYTKGSSHGVIGDCLRDDVYYCNGSCSEGYGLEPVLVENKVDCYFSGHEHIFQHNQSQGVNYFVCGACSETVSYYGGEDKSRKMDWTDTTRQRGFCATVVTKTTMTVSFINTDCQIVYSTTIQK